MRLESLLTTQLYTLKSTLISPDEVWNPNRANLKEKKELILFHELRSKNPMKQKDESTITKRITVP
jgi:DNA repair protein RadC